MPTAAHLRMPLDDFNARLTSESIPLFSFDQRAGAAGAAGNAYRETLLCEVRNMSQVLATQKSTRASRGASVATIAGAASAAAEAPA